MTQSEPMIPGTIFASALVLAAFAIMLMAVIAGLYGLHRLLSWVLG